MMQTVYKQAIPVVSDGIPVVSMPGSARLVRLEVDDRDPSVVLSWWYVPDADAEPERHRVSVLATGQGAPAAWIYLASTAPHPRTGLVWHLWRVVDA
jgi:hypothetical protein